MHLHYCGRLSPGARVPVQQAPLDRFAHAEVEDSRVGGPLTGADRDACRNRPAMMAIVVPGKGLGAMTDRGVEGFVRFDGVQKSYDGKVLVVKDLNLSIGKGEFLTMLGPSGPGRRHAC